MRKLLPIILLLALTACAQVRLGAEVAKQSLPAGEALGAYKVGNPYKIKGEWFYPQESFTYSETGVASWYGPGFHGKSTANGERFSTHELTAAHRTLQMPSFVRVTNLETGRSVVVRINDRGPYVRGRIIDVSSKAADLLGFKGRGTALVRVTVLADESHKVAAAAQEGRRWHGGIPIADDAPPPFKAPLLRPVENAAAVPVHMTKGALYPDPVVSTVPVSGTPDIYVQAGSFASVENANRLREKLAGIGRVQVMGFMAGGAAYHRVRIGPIANVPEADQILALAVKAGAPESRIIVD